jgi:hypothetical protein
MKFEVDREAGKEFYISKAAFERGGELKGLLIRLSSE